MPVRFTSLRRTTAWVASALMAALTAYGCGTDPEERYGVTLDGVCAEVRSALTDYAEAATLTAKDGGGTQRLAGTVQEVAQTFTRGASDLRDADPPGAFAAFNASTADGLQTAGTRLRDIAAPADDADALLDAAQDALGALEAPEPPAGLEARAPRCQA